MKKSIEYYLIGFLLCLTPFSSKAQTNPAWQYDPYAFQYDMSMYISIHQQGVEVDQWDNLVVGAFCGDECRGIATVNQVPDGSHYYYLRVKSNSSQGEVISFRCFDKQTNKETNFEQTIIFEDLRMFGYPSDPYVLNLPFTSTPVLVTGVTLNKNNLTLNVNFSEKLTATVFPTDASDMRVQWSSDNEAIATVDQDGLVTGIKAGTAIITATTVDGNYTAMCNVTIIQLPDGIYLNFTELNLNVGEEVTLKAIVEPEDAQYKLIWSSSDEAVATIDQTGKIKALKAGTTTIVVKTEDGSFTAFCTLTILQPVTGITLNKSGIQLEEGKSEVLIVTVLPDDASDKIVRWESSDESISVVDQNGKVTAVAKGTSIITVTTEDGGFSASCNVEVVSFTDINLVEKETITIFPSEMKDSYYIKNVPERAVISIINMNGYKVKTFMSTGKSIQLVSLNDLSPGVYFIHIKGKNNFDKKILNPHP